MDNKFVQTEKPIKLEDIEEIEIKYGFSFPKDFKTLYMKYNGGSPEKYLYRLEDIVLVVSEFLPVKYGTDKEQLEYYYKDLVLDEKILPNYLVPFAIDPGGDFFCFSIRKEEDYGSIYIWRHEEYENPDAALLYVCCSLEEFIDGLKEEQE